MTNDAGIIILLFILSAIGNVFAEIVVPDKFIGEWDMHVEKVPGFPWWEDVKYPVDLSIKRNGAFFRDQTGSDCIPETFLYDDELDAVVFKHCLPTKSKLAFPPVYQIKILNGQLTGEVWTYKLLFRLVGVPKARNNENVVHKEGMN